MILEKVDEIKDNIQTVIKDKSINLNESELKDRNESLENKTEEKIKENEIITKTDNIVFKEIKIDEIHLNQEKSFEDNLDQNEINNNNSFKLDLEKIEEKDRNLIIDYKDNVNYKSNKFKMNKLFFEENNNENDLDNEDNDIIINENDDSIIHIDYDNSK